MNTPIFGWINNGNTFADFIIDNDLYKQGAFFEHYEQYLPKGFCIDDCFYEDFHYRMSEYGKDINY